MIKIGPTGRIVRGNVLDVAEKPFTQALKDYDPLLYVRWNPVKLRGWGCWEIRRRPEKKSVVEVLPWKGGGIIKIDYRELDIVNNVLDIAFLNYNAINKIKSMDTWKIGAQQWIRDLDYKAAKYEEAQLSKARAESQYVAKQFKHEINDFKELVLSGFNPARIAEHWDEAGS